jgi:pimeloyl-ACP methyl ester carboxylesterase
MSYIPPKELDFVVPEMYNGATGEIVQSHNLKYYQWGSSTQPVILCLHGLVRNGRDFDKLASAISGSFRVISLDIVGRGKSQWLDDTNNYNYETYVNDILEFIRQQNLENLTIIGSSMGGIIGMILANMKPELIKNLLLNDIGPVIPVEVVKNIRNHAASCPEFDSLEELGAYLKRKLRFFGFEEERDFQHIINHSFRYCQDGKYRLSYDPKILYADVEDSADKEGLLWQYWRDIKASTLIIRGENSNILEEATLRQMLETKRDSDYFIAPEVGHTPSLTRSLHINKIFDWLKENTNDDS